MVAERSALTGTRMENVPHQLPHSRDGEVIASD